MTPLRQGVTFGGTSYRNLSPIEAWDSNVTFDHVYIYICVRYVYIYIYIFTQGMYNVYIYIYKYLVLIIWCHNSVANLTERILLMNQGEVANHGYCYFKDLYGGFQRCFDGQHWRSLRLVVEQLSHVVLLCDGSILQSQVWWGNSCHLLAGSVAGARIFQNNSWHLKYTKTKTPVNN